MQNKTIVLKYVVVNFISKVLAQFELDGQASYARRRFLRELKPHVQDLEAEQDGLRKTYAEKDAKGEVRIENNQYVFSPKDRKVFNRKWEELNETTVTIAVDDANAKDFETVQTVLREQADKAEKENTTEGKFNADNFEYVLSLREAADSLKL